MRSPVVRPGYGRNSLAEVLPSVAALLGVPDMTDALGLGTVLPHPRGVVVVLVDGLGASLLDERAGHAPYLRVLSRQAPAGVPTRLAVGFPTTTATGLATLGTGATPGRHGILGFDVLDPASDRIVNQLTWPKDLDPRRWQPMATVLERAAAAGVDVVSIGPAAFQSSGLTQAALRGGRYVAAKTLQARVDATVQAAARSPRLLAYLYWEDLDRTGHHDGCQSDAWTRRLEDVDSAVAGLVRRLPTNTLVIVTADHGMLDVPRAGQIDLAERPDLSRGVRLAAGEPRAVYLWPELGHLDEVAARWRDGLGEAADVMTRDEVVAAGWFGPEADPAMMRRVGELIVLARRRIRVLDSRRHRAEAMTLVGWHGGLSAEEVVVPLLIDAR